MKYCKLLIMPHGERFISVDDLREWIKDPANLERVARLMAKGIDQGADELEVLGKMLIFPAWESERRMLASLDGVSEATEICQCNSCKLAREGEERSRNAHLN